MKFRAPSVRGGQQGDILPRKSCRFGFKSGLTQGARNRNRDRQRNFAVARHRRRGQYCFGALAVINSGGVAIPVDLQSSDEILNHIVEDSSARRIFTDTRGLEKLRRLNLEKKLEVYLFDDEKSPDYFKNIFSKKEVAPTELSVKDQAVIFYTSGTTGMPKGVPLTHKNLVTQIEAVKELSFYSQETRGCYRYHYFTFIHLWSECFHSSHWV